MNTERFQAFSTAYRAGLLAAVTTEPDAYALKAGESPADYAERVAAHMLASMAERPMGVNYDGNGFKRACKALGIKYTRKAIFAYLEV